MGRVMPSSSVAVAGLGCSGGRWSSRRNPLGDLGRLQRRRRLWAPFSFLEALLRTFRSTPSTPPWVLRAKALAPASSEWTMVACSSFPPWGHRLWRPNAAPDRRGLRLHVGLSDRRVWRKPGRRPWREVVCRGGGLGRLCGDGLM
jgi:hypothetical protein